MRLFGPPDIEYMKRKGNIKGLVKALGYKKNSVIGDNAEKALIAAKPPLELLISALLDASGDTRNRIISILGELGDARVVNLLIREMHSDVHRSAARSALRKINDPGAVEPLIKALKDENRDIREFSAEALGNIKDPRAVEPLINAIKDNDVNVKLTSKEALLKIIDIKAVEPLINALKDKNYDIRWSSAEALGNIKDPRAVGPLINALTDNDETVRWASVGALGTIRDPRAVEPLINALKDNHESLRVCSAFALGNIKDPRAIEPLAMALKDPSKNVQSAAAFALSEFKDPRAVEPLIDVLSDKSKKEYERKHSAQELGKIKDPRAVKPLINELQYCNKEIYEIIATSLCEINDPCTENLLLEETWLSNDMFEDLIKRLGIADIEKAITKFELIKRKEQEELIKKREEAIQREEQKENEMLERMKGAGEEIARLTVELIEIGRLYGFLSTQPGGKFDKNCKNIRAREIGTRLDQIAGFKLMREVFDYAAENFSPGSALSQELEVAWDLIGDWQS